MASGSVGTGRDLSLLNHYLAQSCFYLLAQASACAIMKRHYIYFMSRKYKFHDQDKLYFISFATVYWIDLPTGRQVFL